MNCTDKMTWMLLRQKALWIIKAAKPVSVNSPGLFGILDYTVRGSC